MKADLVLSPIRTTFQWGCYNHFCLGNQGSVTALADIIYGNEAGGVGSKTVSAAPYQRIRFVGIAGDSFSPAVVISEIPMFTFWIAEHMKSGSGFIKAAYELRDESEFQSIRRLMTELSGQADAASGNGTRDTIEALNSHFESLVQKYRVNAEKGLTSAAFKSVSDQPSRSKLRDGQNHL
jgi:hypothetical protein